MNEALPDAAVPPTDRGRRRKEAILDAAADLFETRGFHGASMDDLGAAAGISGPGLYRHFASKDALLMAVLDRIWTQLKPAVDRSARLPPDEAIDRLLDAHLDLAVGQPAALVLLVRELRHLPDDYRELARRNHARYVDAWATAVRATHAGLDDAQARDVALALHGLIDSVAVRGERRVRDRDRAQLRGLLDRLARGALDAAGQPTSSGSDDRPGGAIPAG